MAAHNKLTQKQIEAAKADGKQSKLADGDGNGIGSGNGSGYGNG